MAWEPIVEEIQLPAPMKSGPAPAGALFARLAHEPGSFFLDSSLTHPVLGRYSFLGSDPFLTFLSKDNQIEIRRPNGTERIQGNPFRYLKRLFSRYRIVRPFGLPPLLGGAVGYFAYDLCQFVERLPSAARDDVPIPDCYLGFYDVLLAIDHQEDRAYLCSSGLPETDERKAQERAKARLDQFREKLLGGKGGSGTGGTATFPDLLSRPSENSSTHLTSNFTREDYLEAVRRAKEYIAAGDIYQVNLSQRLAVPIPEHPFQLYRRLREINPAPFSAYLNLGMDDITIVSSSPERFLKVEGDLVETRPIKGTRPRGQTPQEDERLAQELINSEKDRAENVMIVDLERNDLGKVCRYGSVRVRELFGLEKYATVWHLVSTVEGRLHRGKTLLDLLRACFPGGSITGAPKVRSMEIIDELEPTKRGVYTGGIGYLSFSGEMDLNIVIRTFTVKQGRGYFQVGGGIVADSDPESEYQETLDKGKALAEAATGRAGIEVDTR